MPWSGSAPNQTYGRTDGVRSGAAVCVQARTALVNDTAELADARENDFATAINLCVNRAGGNTASAALPMGGFNHTGVGLATARTHYARADQVADGSLYYGGEAGGTADALTLTLSPAITAYAAGAIVVFKAAADNTSVDVTVNINSVGAVAIMKHDGATKPAVGEIQDNGMYAILCDGTQWLLLGSVSPNVAAFAALTGAADKLAYFTGAGAMTLADFTAAGRALLDDANAAAQRTTLGLGTMAVEAAATYLTKADNLGSVASAATAFGNIKQAASDTATGVLEIADQSEMETGSSNTLAVVPGRQHFHPGHPKCWASVSVSGGTPTLDASYNVTGIADTSLGQLTVTIATDFSSANWAAVSSADGLFSTIANKLAGSVLLQARNSSGDPDDPSFYTLIGCGDQA
jgi:hypothetical protein